MKVIILGCGRVGSTLAGSMARDGHDVTIIDRQRNAFRRLPSDYKGVTLVGNGIDESILRKAGIEKADAFVAVTNGDNTNIMSVQIAKVKFNVEKCMARVYDPIRACAYQELGVDTLCTTIVGTRLFKNKLLGKELGLATDYCSIGEDDIIA